MRKYMTIILAAIILPMAAYAQETEIEEPNTFKGFSLSVTTGPSMTGFYATDSEAATGFWNLSVSPDWRFNEHWGLLLDVGVGGAIAGMGAQDQNDTFQTELYVGPYCEWDFQKGFVAVMAGIWLRYREPFYSGVPARFGQSLGVGSAVGFRGGVKVSERVDIFGCLRLEPRVYDILERRGDNYINTRIAGNANLSVGVRIRLSH